MEVLKAGAGRAHRAGPGGSAEGGRAGRLRRLLASARLRLIVVVLLTLAPIAGLNIVQGFLQWRTAEEEARQRLLQNATASAVTVDGVFASAENVLQALGTLEEVREAGPQCADILNGARVTLPFVANIGVIDAEGGIRCSALPITETSVRRYEWWRTLPNASGFVLSGKLLDPAASSEMIVGLLPQRRDGRFTGALALGIDLRWLQNLMKRETPPQSGIVAVFSPRGEELVSNSAAMSAVLFGAGRPAGEGRLSEAVDASGRVWTYATAELERSRLEVAFALPRETVFGWRVAALTAAIAIPVIFAGLSLVALWLAVDHIVLRWLTYLRRVTAVYAHGHYRFRPRRLEEAPTEFRVLGDSVEDMASAVRERDARLRESLAEKTALVREIHHRIKNSLQVVVSLLSLYGGGVRRPEDRARFDQLRMRVNTLALVHRILYEASDGSQVRLGELLRELAALIEGAGERSLEITVEAPDAPLATDMAVPLALMVVEIVLDIAACREEGAPALPVRLRAGVDGDRLAIAAFAPCPPREADPPAGLDLAAGFASQLGGELTRLSADGDLEVSGVFPCRAPRPRPAPAAA